MPFSFVHFDTSYYIILYSSQFTWIDFLFLILMNNLLFQLNLCSFAVVVAAAVGELTQKEIELGRKLIYFFYIFIFLLKFFFLSCFLLLFHELAMDNYSASTVLHSMVDHVVLFQSILLEFFFLFFCCSIYLVLFNILLRPNRGPLACSL